ncbi:MAG: hypothetical protein IPL46_14770 [Saprospiraceae bacterium]|nr:hypothetical protein [Saprospiraceae bacterium]
MPTAFAILFSIRLIFGFLFMSNVSGQADLSSKLRLYGVDVYRDHSQKNLYYYSPSEIKLQTSSTGAPSIVLLQMRYTGTFLYSDKDFKGFHNILQLSVVLSSLPTSTYDLIRKNLGFNVDLRPLPIKKFHSELIIPVGDMSLANEKYRKIIMGGVEASGETNSANSFWQERTFTLQLDNNDAQLLWDQLESGKLGLSFSYAFYAEAIPGTVGEMLETGPKKPISAEDLPDDAVFDDRLNTYLINGNAFPIHVGREYLSDCLKRVDINEELPPAYASFEVRCYDFADDLRPDLFKKIVEIKAFAAAKEYISTKAEFNRNSRDISGKSVRFSYAIRLDQPLEYRIIEVNVNGEMDVSPWIEKKDWSEVIDITTPQLLNSFSKKNLDVELDLVQMASSDLTEMECEVRYVCNRQELSQIIKWTESDEVGIRNVTFSYDISTQIGYRLILKDPSGIKILKFKSIDSSDDYLFIDLQKEFR